MFVRLLALLPIIALACAIPLVGCSGSPPTERTPKKPTLVEPWHSIDAPIRDAKIVHQSETFIKLRYPAHGNEEYSVDLYEVWIEKLTAAGWIVRRKPTTTPPRGGVLVLMDRRRATLGAQPVWEEPHGKSVDITVSIADSNQTPDKLIESWKQLDLPLTDALIWRQSPVHVALLFPTYGWADTDKVATRAFRTALTKAGWEDHGLQARRDVDGPNTHRYAMTTADNKRATLQVDSMVDAVQVTVYVYEDKTKGDE